MNAGETPFAAGANANKYALGRLLERAGCEFSYTQDRRACAADRNRGRSPLSGRGKISSTLTLYIIAKDSL